MSNFLEKNITIFQGKVAEGESTVMPASRAWVRNMATDMGNTSDDHSIFIFVNYPSLGIAGAAKNGFLLNYVTNILSDHPANAVCFVVHPNRAGQQEGRSLDWRHVPTCTAEHISLLVFHILHYFVVLLAKKKLTVI